MSWNSPPSDWIARVPLIIERNMLEKMASGGPREIDSFLLREIHLLQNEYMRIGNPRLIYLAGSSIADVVKPLRGCTSSFQFSRLQAFLAEMLLAQGQDAHSLRAALHHMEVAFDTVNRVHAISEDIIRANVSYALLTGVINKALGKLEESLSGMRSTAWHLAWEKSATELDLIPLRRQEIMMYQSVAGHRKLAEEAVRYINLQPRQYYQSLKRVFEFLLNTGRIREADQIYAEFKRAFTTISRQSPPISHVSFLKNIGQYLVAKGDAPAASSILKRTLQEANQRNLQGQVRQVKSLTNELEAGSNQATLVTFTVDNAP